MKKKSPPGIYPSKVSISRVKLFPRGELTHGGGRGRTNSPDDRSTFPRGQGSLFLALTVASSRASMGQQLSNFTRGVFPVLKPRNGVERRRIMANEGLGDRPSKTVRFQCDDSVLGGDVLCRTVPGHRSQYRG